ncbi:hypothetical protein [uncultured Dokdonia sp.]|uniref:hypothetical protein n=1 Tax=uncultured Dokdonia sp. TaxID=575653 RepID=UPI00260FA455|nr:hypothetical protein [uncultured Dokdonia sp.]
MKNKLKIVSLISYSLIILMGEMIGIPFLMWLIFTSFDFGNIEQFFAIIGLTGIILSFTKYWRLRIVKILSFILLISPLIKRMREIPIEKFNYLAFQVPLVIFVITYLILIIKRNKITVGNKELS